ncbi:PEP-utilizing enzyme [Bacteriovoracaceae bacterium]|nr:PEP-utilizing enzyme [Bacteriovoracaceae bacterium]
MKDGAWILPREGTETDSSFTSEQVGLKGYNLLKLSQYKLQIPEGFILTSEELVTSEIDDLIKSKIQSQIKQLEIITKKKFGDNQNEPLLLAVRSSPSRSLPGVLDSILNIGLNNKIIQSLRNNTNYLMHMDNYRRFIKDFSVSVYKVNASYFEMLEFDLLDELGLTNFSQCNEDHFLFLFQQFKNLLLQEKGMTIPEDPITQVYMSAQAVLGSGYQAGVESLSKEKKITLGLIFQRMVYGNFSSSSLSGVMSNHNPLTGVRELWGEYLFNTQGKEIVSGVITGTKLTSNLKSESRLNEVYLNKMISVLKIIENKFKDIQEIEFTFQDKELFILQTRRASLSLAAKLKVICLQIENNDISKDEALKKLNIDEVKSYLLGLQLEKKRDTSMARGLAASSGIASGVIALDRKDIQYFETNQMPYIFVRKQSVTSEIDLIKTSQGILTASGGVTSHAAVISRSLNKPCVVGCQLLSIDFEAKKISINNKTLSCGDFITIDGNSGLIYEGEEEILIDGLNENTKKLYHWLDSDYN